jgi:hypothetical protein
MPSRSELHHHMPDDEESVLPGGRRRSRPQPDMLLFLAPRVAPQHSNAQVFESHLIAEELFNVLHCS